MYNEVRLVKIGKRGGRGVCSCAENNSFVVTKKKNCSGLLVSGDIEVNHCNFGLPITLFVIAKMKWLEWSRLRMKTN